MFTIGLIGFGSAGGRFLRTIIYRQSKVGDVKLLAVCDTNQKNFEMCKEIGVKTYSNVKEMLIAENYDIIIVTTNEDSHYQIICAINKYSKNCKRIIVEKPLVQQFEQAVSIQNMFDNEDISVHFVERYSPIIPKLMDWIYENNLKICRATFFWGKYRLHDMRPTIGVTSEISHPIDLILMLTNTPIGTPYKIHNGCYLFSDFSISGNRVLDTINVNMSFDTGLIITSE